jgi:hypothetical protein
MRSNFGHSISLFPFWCLDAKGGEVVLVGSHRGFAWEDTSAFGSIVISLLMSMYFVYLHFHWIWLCETCGGHQFKSMCLL